MSARLSSVSTFSQIAREHFDKFLECEAQLNKIKISLLNDSLDDFQGKISVLEQAIGKHGVVVIVFAGMALDAYIYDYAARNLSDSFVRKYLDKLDIVSKWVIVPRLITGQEIQRNSRGFQLLVQLVKQRNNIVHSKSIGLEASRKEEILETYGDFHKKFPAVVREAIDTLDTLAVAMKTIDPNELTSLYFGTE